MPAEAADVRSYLTDYLPFYGSVQRDMFQALKHGVLDEMSRSKFVTTIIKQHGVLKRTANSIIYDMNGRIRAYLELKKTELTQLTQKLATVEDKILKNEEFIGKAKPLVAMNAADDEFLACYRAAKRSLYHLKNKRNMLKQKIANLQKAIEEKKVSICFGTKKMFEKQNRLEDNGYKTHEKWHHDFVARRDSGIFFLGAGGEKYGNQILQLRYTGSDFTMALLKDKPFRKDGNRQLTLEHVKFPYMQDELQAAIAAGRPITCRISRRGRKWYLTASFTIEVPVDTFSVDGVFGIDYNSGFLEVVESDHSGNMKSADHIVLEYHGTGNKAESEIKEKLSRIVRQARDAKKDIVVENLNFTKKKAATRKAKSRKGKKYNTMIHQFDFSRYLFWTENLCAKYGVGFTKVNPAYTSRKGKTKYAIPRKMTVHRAAALMIARRGQGFKD